MGNRLFSTTENEYFILFGWPHISVIVLSHKMYKKSKKKKKKRWHYVCHTDDTG
jgi:hypothetical protein